MRQRFARRRILGNSNTQTVVESSATRSDAAWCGDNQCLQSAYEVWLAAYRATSLVHLMVLDCGREDTVAESRDDCCRWGQLGSCISFENDWSVCSQRETLPANNDTNRFDVGPVPSNLSSSSSYQRKRPLAIAVGTNHLADADGRLVVVTPTKKKGGKSSLAGSPSRSGLESASSSIGSGASPRLPATGIPESLLFPIAQSNSSEAAKPTKSNVLQHRFGLGRLSKDDNSKTT